MSANMILKVERCFCGVEIKRSVGGERCPLLMLRFFQGRPRPFRHMPLSRQKRGLHLQGICRWAMK